MATFNAIFMSSPLNTGYFDTFLQICGILFCALLLYLFEFSGAAKRLRIIRLFLAFSITVTVILAYMLKFSPPIEYAHVYWIAQSLSYLIEVALCIEFANHIIVNNWYLTAIFAPFIFAVTAGTFLIYGIPRGLQDITRPAYINTLTCGFILLMVWLLSGRFEGKLEQPYSGIAFFFACYISIRFCVNYLHSYYGPAHREIISRLEPINEIFLLVGWLSVLLYYFPNTNLTPYDRKNPLSLP